MVIIITTLGLSKSISISKIDIILDFQFSMYLPYEVSG